MYNLTMCPYTYGQRLRQRLTRQCRWQLWNIGNRYRVRFEVDRVVFGSNRLEVGGAHSSSLHSAVTRGVGSGRTGRAPRGLAPTHALHYVYPALLINHLTLLLFIPIFGATGSLFNVNVA